MKFLFLTSRFSPSIGGVERHALEVASELIRRGHDVRVVTESLDHSERTGVVGRIRVQRIYFGTKGWFKKFQLWARMVHADVRANVDWADVVVCHDVFFWYMSLRFLFPRKRVVTVFHGYETRVPPARSAVWIRRLSRFLSHKAVHVGAYIQSWYGTRADRTLYEPVYAARQIPAGTSLARPLKIALIGRLARDMGITTYASACALLKKWGVPFELDVYGDGPESGVIAPFGKLHGFVADPSPFIARADVVCASGYVSLLEALQHGKVCFAVYENQLKKEYLENSFVRDWAWIGHDGSELAEALRNARMWNQDQLKHLKRDMKRYDWKAVTDMYEDLCTL